MNQELISSIRFRVKSLPLGSNESETIRTAILEDLETLEKGPAPVIAEPVDPILDSVIPATEADFYQPVQSEPESTGSPEGERRPSKKRK